jgi:hypothetical protein
VFGESEAGLSCTVPADGFDTNAEFIPPEPDHTLFGALKPWSRASNTTGPPVKHILFTSGTEASIVRLGNGLMVSPILVAVPSQLFTVCVARNEYVEAVVLSMPKAAAVGLLVCVINVPVTPLYQRTDVPVTTRSLFGTVWLTQYSRLKSDAGAAGLGFTVNVSASGACLLSQPLIVRVT